MTLYKDRPFFSPGEHSPPHCRNGRWKFSTYRASGDMNCPSQCFSIPLQYNMRFVCSMAMVHYLGSTCSTRVVHEKIPGLSGDVQCKFDRRRPCEGKSMELYSPGVYTPPRRTGRWKFSMYRASGVVNCPSQLFPIPFLCNMRFVYSMAMVRYLDNTCNTRDSTGALRRCPTQVLDRRRPWVGKVQGYRNCGEKKKH